MALNLKSHKVALTVIGIFLLVAAGLGYYLWTRGEVSTDDAFVDGHLFTITPRVSGYVTNVLVDDNQRVAKGEALVTLDRTDYEVAVAQAKANLAQSKSMLTSLELGVPLQLRQTAEQVRGAKAELQSLRKQLDQLQQEQDAAAQEVKRLQAQYHLAQLDLERQQLLRTSGAVSQQTLDNAKTNFESVDAQLKNAQAKLEATKKQRASQQANIQLREANIALAATGKEQAEIKARETDAQKAKVALAEAELKQAELNLTYTTIASPTDGYVTEKKIESGQFVSPGQQLFTVVPLNPRDLWITANYKETQLEGVRPGQYVDIEVDTYPGYTFKGKVDSLMAGTGAAFSLFPPENATGNYVKVVQRIPVKIVLESDDWRALPTLRIGMSVVPTIFTTENVHGKTRNKQMADNHRSDGAHPH